MLKQVILLFCKQLDCRLLLSYSIKIFNIFLSSSKAAFPAERKHSHFTSQKRYVKYVSFFYIFHL
jgi:hypothetical protein